MYTYAVTLQITTSPLELLDLILKCWKLTSFAYDSGKRQTQINGLIPFHGVYFGEFFLGYFADRVAVTFSNTLIVCF